MNNFKTKCIIPVLLFFSLVLHSQTPLNIWSLNDTYSTNGKPDNKFKSNQDHIVFYKLQKEALKKALKGLKNNEVIKINFPLVNGDLVAFNVTESSIFAPGLAKKYPQIKTYKGTGIDNPLATLRFSVSQIGLHALLHDNSGKVHYIEPESKESDVYKVFDRGYYGTHKIGLDCFTESSSTLDLEEVSSKISNRAVTNDVNLFEDSKLRTFRLALSCTGE